jgi:hypothetical protein
MTEKRCPKIGDRVKITFCTAYGGDKGQVVWVNRRVTTKHTQWKVLWGIKLDSIGRMIGYQRGCFRIIGNNTRSEQNAE